MDTNKQLREMHLFAGAGGGILGGLLCGHKPVCAVEIEEYPRRVLIQRQRDGIFPGFPIWDDVTTFDGRPWRGSVDVICGGFPCQDISAAGKGAGITGTRSGLWKEYARIIDEVRPKYVFAENSPLLRTRGLGVVLEDLAEMGYDAKWGVLGAWHAGAPHKRDRMWVLAHAKSKRTWNECENIRKASGKVYAPNDTGSTCRRDDKPKNREHVAHANGAGRGQSHEEVAGEIPEQPDGHSIQPASPPRPENVAHANMQHGQRGTESQQPSSDSGEARDKSTRGGTENVAHANNQGLQGGQCSEIINQKGRKEPDGRFAKCGGLWWENDPAIERTGSNEFQEDPTAQPFVGRVAHGVADRVHRLKAIGNGQVPEVARIAWELLSGVR